MIQIDTPFNYRYSQYYPSVKALQAKTSIYKARLNTKYDCMVYGHTHQAVCHQVGDRLIINLGRFKAAGRYGAPGTYAILEVGNVLQATIHEVPQLS